MLASAFAVGWWTILFWIFIGIAIGGLIAWSLGKSDSTTTSSVDHLAALDGKRATVKADISHPNDQLEAIEGVGPQIAELFHKNGINRFSQIAAMTPADIGKILAAGGGAFAIAQPHTWPLQATVLANGHLDEFLKLGQMLTAGRLPLTGLAGVGEATAAKLHDAGIGSVEGLAGADAAGVAAKLAAAGDTVAESRIAEWIAEARAVASGDIAKLAAFLGLPAAVLSARQAGNWTESREVSGPLQNARALFADTVTTTATARGPSLLPFWIGLVPAIGLALLCLLRIWCPTLPVVPVVENTEVVLEQPETPAAAPAAAPAVAPEGAGVRTEERAGRPLLVVFFATDKRDVSNELTAESAKLKDYLDTHPDARLSVSGYNDPRGNAAYNAELSKNRAQNVAAALAKAGFDRSRIDLDKPQSTTPGESSFAADRKVEVSIKEPGDAAGAPTAVTPPAK